MNNPTHTNKDSLREDIEQKIDSIVSRVCCELCKGDLHDWIGSNCSISAETAKQEILTLLTSHIEEAERKAREDEIKNTLKEFESEPKWLGRLHFENRLEQLKQTKGVE